MNRFFSWLLDNRLLVLLLVAVALVGGWISWVRLPIDAFPDVTNTQVMILSKAPGLAALDVEQRVSMPIEQAMGGLPRVTDVRSLSRAELSQVVVIFEDDADTWWTRQVVFERLDDARELLPEGVEPELGPVSTGLGEVLQYTLESDPGPDGRPLWSPMDLRTFQDWIVTPLLKPVRGVNEVNSFGGEVKEYQVLVHPERLQKYGLTVDEVSSALARGNANAAGGVLVRGWEQIYLRGVGLLRDLPDIERVVLKAEGGTPIFVKDVADVVIGQMPRQGAVSRDGRGEAVAGMVIMLKGENASEVVARVHERLPQVRGALPDGVSLDVFYDRSSLVEACIETVQGALIAGGFFVILVLFLLLAEMRTALIVLFSLPLTFLVSFVVMRQVGLSSNLMSLGGLAFSVGMVVDASIVVVENIRRHLAHADPATPRRAVVLQAVGEVASPVAFSVLIITVILVPLYTLQGIEGRMFEPLATTMLIALLVSLLVALVVSPVLASIFLRGGAEREFAFVHRLREGYARLLGRAVGSPRLTIGISAATLVLALALTPLVGTEFMPPLDEGAIAINVVRLPNASLDGSVRVADYLEKRLLRFPEVETVVSKTGRAEVSEDPMGPEQTDVMILLHPRKEWKTGRDKEELVAAIQADLSQVPGIRLAFSQPIALRVNELISGIKSDLAIKVYGTDLEHLKELSDRVATVLRGIPGAEDVRVEQVSGMDQYDLDIDREAAARHGIDVAAINEVIETGVAGRVATTLLEEQRRIAVTVRFLAERREDIDDIGRLLVAAPDGHRVPIASLARIRRVEAPSQVSRENGMRRVTAEAKERLTSLEAELPPGYFLDYSGQFENQQRAMRQLSIVVPIALVLIFVLLFMALRSMGRSLLVALNLPFALVGGLLGILAFGLHLSVSAAVAFIVLLGIAVQNGVVLVAFFRQLREAGRTVAETVQEGCRLRFRPLLMTALTSFIGHLPMLYAQGSGADIQRPLAVVVMGGLISSTLLTLLVIPAVYSLLAGKAEARA
jgi:cobalt-zinc-cadmium resistance protein CzcA